MRINNLQELQKELQKELQTIGRQIADISRATKYDEYEDFSGIVTESTDAETLFLLDELRGAMAKLDDARRVIEYLQAPIIETGTLHKNARDRYELPSGYEFTSGYGVEILLPGDEYDPPQWIAGAIEHNRRDYYFTRRPDMPLEGATARRRERKW